MSRALELKPDYAEGNNNLAVVYARLGRFAEAYMNLGKGLCDLGDLQSGTAHLRRALTLNRYSPEIHNNLGAALARQGKLDEAIGHFTLALRLRPDYEQAQLNLQLAQEER